MSNDDRENEPRRGHPTNPDEERRRRQADRERRRQEGGGKGSPRGESRAKSGSRQSDAAAGAGRKTGTRGGGSGRSRSSSSGRRAGGADSQVFRRRRLIALVAAGALAVLVLILVLVGSGGGVSDAELQAQEAARQAEIRREEALKLAREKNRQERAIEEVQRYSPLVTNGGGKKRAVALTFDDGPGVSTPDVLKVLRRTKTPATFFVAGNMVEENPEILKQVEKEGHVVANHTQTHADLATLDVTGQTAEIQNQKKAVEKTGVEQWNLFRPPYRSFNDTTMSILDESSDLMITWDVDSEDYASPAPEVMAAQVLSDAKAGSIVLMHDGPSDRTSTVKALPTIIRGLKKRGFKLVTVPQLLADDPPAREPGSAGADSTDSADGVEEGTGDVPAV